VLWTGMMGSKPYPTMGHDNRTAQRDDD